MAEIIKLVSKARDICPRGHCQLATATSFGNGTWTRVIGVLAELEAMIAVYRRLGGPELPSNVERFAVECRGNGTPCPTVIGES